MREGGGKRSGREKRVKSREGGREKRREGVKKERREGEREEGGRE